VARFDVGFSCGGLQCSDSVEVGYGIQHGCLGAPAGGWLRQATAAQNVLVGT
jgi:hypothetical protein